MDTQRSDQNRGSTTTLVKPLLLAYAAGAVSELPPRIHAAGIESCLVRQLPTASALNAARPIIVLLDRQLVAGVADVAERLRGLADVAALVWCAAPNEGARSDGLLDELAVEVLPHDASITATAALLRRAMWHALSLRNQRLAIGAADPATTVAPAPSRTRRSARASRASRASRARVRPEDVADASAYRTIARSAQ